MPDAGLMRGKRGLIMGVANNRSIAWGIAKAARAHGADLAFTYQGDALKKRVEPLAEEVDGLVVGHCDVTDEASIDAVFAAVKSAWGSLDFVLHAIAFSDKDQLVGRYVETTADNFTKTLLISCYSFTAVAQRAEKLMPNGGSLLTLTYYGAEKWMPHYNVMGVAKAALEASVRYLAADLGEKNIRVNAISAGPIKTLAAAGIGDFRYILKWNEYNAPLRRTVTIEEVGDVGGLSALRHVAQRDRRSAPRRCRLSHRRHEEPGGAGHRAVEGLRHHPAAVRDRDAPLKCRSPALLHPPRRDRLESRRPPAGPARHPDQREWPRAGAPLRRDPARPAGARRRRSGAARFRRKPARARARDHADCAHRTRARSAELSHRRAADRNLVRRLGRLHARGAARSAGPRRSRRANATSGTYTPPRARKATPTMSLRVRELVRLADARHGRGRAWRRRCAG